MKTYEKLYLYLYNLSVYFGWRNEYSRLHAQLIDLAAAGVDG